MSGTLFFPPISTAFDGTGLSVAGAELYSYETETTTPASLYLDAGLATPAANPVVADSSGRFTPLYMDPETTYKITLRGAPLDEVTPGDILWEADPYIDGSGLGRFLSATAKLETDRGETTRQIIDGSVWNLSETDGYTPDDANGATTVLRDDGRLWERVLETNVIQANWWPIQTGRSSENSRAWNDIVAYATKKIGEGATGGLKMEWPAGYYVFPDRVDNLPSGLGLQADSYGSCILSCGYQLPDFVLAPTTLTTPLTVAIGTDTTPDYNLGVMVFEKVELSGHDPIWRLRELASSEFSMTRTATETTVTPTTQWPEAETGYTRNVRIYDKERRFFVGITGQQTNIANHPVIEYGKGPNDEVYDGGVGIGVYARDDSGTGPEINAGDDIYIGAEITGFSRWTFCVELDGGENIVVPQGIRDFNFGDMTTFNALWAGLHARTMRGNHLGQWKHTATGAQSVYDFIITGSYGANMGTSNCTGIFSGSGGRILYDDCFNIITMATGFNHVMITAEAANIFHAQSQALTSVTCHSTAAHIQDRYTVTRAEGQQLRSLPGTNNLLNFTEGNTARGSIGYIANNPDLRLDANNEDIQAFGKTFTFTDNVLGGGRVLKGNECYPFTDGGANVGRADIAYNNVYSVNAATTTSDARLKTNREVIDANHPLFEALTAIVKEVPHVRYKWLPREGGEVDDDWHYGHFAQELIALCERHGVDPYKQGFIISTPWMEHVKVGERETVDDNGVKTVTDVMDFVQRIDPDTNEPMEKLSIRYGELDRIIYAVERWERQSLEARIAALEA